MFQSGFVIAPRAAFRLTPPAVFMKYLDENPTFVEANEFIRALHGKTLRWELPNDCTRWQADLGASISVEEASTGRVAVKIFGGLAIRVAGSQPSIPPNPYSLYLTAEAIALVRPDAKGHADFCAIAPAQG